MPTQTNELAAGQYWLFYVYDRDGPTGIRTQDQPVMSRPLSPLSYGPVRALRAEFIGPSTALIEYTTNARPTASHAASPGMSQNYR